MASRSTAVFDEHGSAILPRAAKHLPGRFHHCENIAFGVPRADRSDRVRQAADQAQIAEFIESLPRVIMLVGERGIRLSGGQRQRIGIARALYKQATVLISTKQPVHWTALPKRR